jgi:ARG and Rhodanese-Phosphatase-superfamily-associated Protein domain
MSAIYERHASSVEEFIRAFTCHDHQAGLAFAINGRVLGLEILDRPDVFRRFFPKLIRSYALDALDADSTATSASVEHVCALVTRLGASSAFIDTALGIGKDVRFDSPQVSGAALFAQERYVHICAFEKDGGSTSAFGTRMTRPSHRRAF